MSVLSIVERNRRKLPLFVSRGSLRHTSLKLLTYQGSKVHQKLINNRLNKHLNQFSSIMTELFLLTIILLLPQILIMAVWKKSQYISIILISSKCAHFHLTHLQLHSKRSHPLIVVMRFSVSAIQTLAFFPTWYTSSEALTIIFVARRFLARAFSSRYIGGNSWKMSWISMICDPLSMVNSSRVVRMVSATGTNTFFST